MLYIETPYCTDMPNPNQSIRIFQEESRLVVTVTTMHRVGGVRLRYDRDNNLGNLKNLIQYVAQRFGICLINIQTNSPPPDVPRKF